MSDTPEILPPSPREVIPETKHSESWKRIRPWIVVGSTAVGVGLLGWSASNFLTVRGVVSVTVSRVLLGTAAAGGILVVLNLVRFLPKLRRTALFVGTAAVLASAFAVDKFTPRPKEPAVTIASVSTSNSADSNAVTRSVLGLSLALITTTHRIPGPAGAQMKGGQNDLVGVLRVRQQNGRSIRHVRSIQFVGKVEADFNSYMTNFAKGDGSEPIPDLERRFTQLKPFFRVSWIAFPSAAVRIDSPDDEEFAKFKITRSLSAIEFTGNPRDYFGFESSRLEPKLPMTTPVWSQLVTFSGTDSATLTGIHPVLRKEVRTGSVQIRVDLDGELIPIPVNEIKLPWSVSLTDGVVEKELAQDLFYGIDNGIRGGLPKSRDPLVKPLVESNGPMVHLIFKEAPALTEVRKDHISHTIDSFFAYLTDLGFVIEKEFPPLGVTSGNASKSAGIYPGSVYYKHVLIPENKIDDDHTILWVYANQIFTDLFNAPTLASRDGVTMVAPRVFANYYVSSYEDRLRANSDKWLDKLWEVRKREGKGFADRSLFYTYKLWEDPPPTRSDNNFDEFFKGKFLSGMNVVANGAEQYVEAAKVISAN